MLDARYVPTVAVGLSALLFSYFITAASPLLFTIALMAFFVGLPLTHRYIQVTTVGSPSSSPVQLDQARAEAYPTYSAYTTPFKPSAVPLTTSYLHPKPSSLPIRAAAPYSSPRSSAISSAPPPLLSWNAAPTYLPALQSRRLGPAHTEPGYPPASSMRSGGHAPTRASCVRI